MKTVIRHESEMKDSGIDTVEKMPLSWSKIRLKNLVKIRTGNEDTQNATPNGKYRFYVRSPIVERCDRYTFEGEAILVAGDGAGAGRIFHLVNGRYAVHQRVYCLSDFKYNAKFVHYYLENLFPFEMDKGSAQSTVPSMRLPMLLNFNLVLPDENECLKIVDYLDETCSKIDKIIAEAKTSIDEYKNLRESVISNATTYGIKKNRCVKSSSAEWVLEIPTDWDMIPAKALFSQSNERKHADDVQLTASQKYGIISQVEYMKRENSRIVIATQGIENWKHVEPNDFIISLRSFQGGLEKSDVSGCITWHYVVLKPNNGVYCDYFKWLFKSDKYINALQGTCNFIRDGQDLRFSNFIQVPLLAVPIEEQKEIANYLNKEVPKIDFLITEKQSLIADLEAYKKSLIYEVVTGKRKVV